MQNGLIEKLNRSYRKAVLDMFVFQSLHEVREQTENWIKEYNEERPHESRAPCRRGINPKTGNFE
jgi:putative transposase